MRTFALIMAACAASTLNWTTPASAAPRAVEQRLGRITITSEGKGPVVVLIPGLASPAAVFDDVAARIGKNHRLIRVQVNGFGGSKAGADSATNLLSGAVDDLAGWLAANRVEKPAVIGHSMGGLMALMLAKAHPEATGRVMVVDALPFYGMLFGPTVTPEAVRPFAEQMRQALISGKAPTEAPPHMSNSEAGRAKIVAWMAASDPKVVGEALVEDATTDLRPSLPDLAGVPVTILYSVPSPDRKDVSAQLYGGAYKALPGAKLIPVEGSEHFIMLDQPAKFDAEVADFLR